MADVIATRKIGRNDIIIEKCPDKTITKNSLLAWMCREMGIWQMLVCHKSMAHKKNCFGLESSLYCKWRINNLFISASKNMACYCAYSCSCKSNKMIHKDKESVILGFGAAI